MTETKDDYVNYRLVGDQLILVFNNREPITVEKTNPNYQRILEILKNYATTSDGIPLFGRDIDDLVELASPKKFVQNWVSDSGIELRGGSLYYRGEALNGYIVEVILRMIDEGQQVRPLVNFLERLLKNPNSGIRDQLYGFLEYGKNAITPDGCFLAYKYVDRNLKSCHAGFYDANGNYDPNGRFDHTIGSFVSMPRERCDNDPNRTCSSGLHVCSREYLGHSWTSGAHRIVVCKVDPADVVAVPTDYNNTKMRTCRYKVVGELTSAEVENDVLARNTVNNSYEENVDIWYNTDPFSSFIDSITYNVDSRTLIIIFSSGNTYEYYDVSRTMAKDFLDSDNHSQYFTDYIEGEYDYERVG